MTEDTARLSLPMLAAGQAQKEMTHNEALLLIDLLVQASVREAPRDTPPTDPEPGACWIVGALPAGDWSQAAGALATWTMGGWRFAAPREGMSAWVEDDAVLARYTGGAWRIGSAASIVPTPSGGAIIDAEARAAIAAILATLRSADLIAG